MVLRSRSSRTLSQTALISSLAIPLVYGCAVAIPVDGTGGSGGTTASGGSGIPGGGSSSGGKVNAGGGPATGGTVQGGGVGGGGNVGGAAPGGGPSSGGANVGGGAPAGGGEGVGGGAPAGGGTGTGGASPGGGKWGEVEDPGAACTVGPMPSVGSLTADPKLPDPFKKMDGTRMTSKSEWLCRREEILKQGQAFIFGEKPIPPKDAVTGTVSSSSISVKVTGGKKDATFSVTVNMNGATAPAPAILSYGAGAPVPSGVAKITFTAIEGGSGAKKGPFYDYYGTDHPAGYLTAQAWQVSRILDVLEKTPGVIDPHKFGVTGCSRNGKGAFVGGVLDNRIALTIPVESGISGTVGLRLVEVLDSYSGSEWPYHGISYVRWHSEVALGQFTTGNSASADNTAKLPVDMHEMMALIAPRGLYVVDNPSTNYPGLDKNAAWVTGNVGKMIFEGLGVGDHLAYQGASGGHCSWRKEYDPSLKAMIDKFLLGKDSTATGNVATDLPSKPDHKTHIAWEVPTLTGEL